MSRHFRETSSGNYSAIIVCTLVFIIPIILINVILLPGILVREGRFALPILVFVWLAIMLAIFSQGTERGIRSKALSGDDVAGDYTMHYHTLMDKENAYPNYRLPDRCPSCGKEMDALKSEWADTLTVYCAHCKVRVRYFQSDLLSG